MIFVADGILLDCNMVKNKILNVLQIKLAGKLDLGLLDIMGNFLIFYISNFFFRF